MADGNIKVSVESVVHDVLAELAQTLVNEHGVRLKSINFNWSGIEIMGETAQWNLLSVFIESEKRI